MDINRALVLHPNLLNNYRCAAMHLVLAADMADRGEYSSNRDRHLFRAGMLLGTAQGWLNRHYPGMSMGQPGYDYTVNWARSIYKNNIL